MKKIIIIAIVTFLSVETFSQVWSYPTLPAPDPIPIGALDTIPIQALVSTNDNVLTLSVKMWKVNERVAPSYSELSYYPRLNYWKLKEYLTEDKKPFIGEVWLTKELPYTPKVWETPKVYELPKADTSTVETGSDTAHFNPGQYLVLSDSQYVKGGIWRISDTTSLFTLYKKNYSFYAHQVLASTISTGLVYHFRNVMVNVRYIKGEKFYYIKGKKFRPVSL